MHFIPLSQYASKSVTLSIPNMFVADQARTSSASYWYCFAYAGISVPCVYYVESTYAMHRLTLSCSHNRGEPIRVAGVVVVDIAGRVDIPRIVRIATIRRTQPNVLSTTYIPYCFAFASCHFWTRALVSRVICDQYCTLFPLRWNSLRAMLISASSSLHFRIACL